MHEANPRPTNQTQQKSSFMEFRPLFWFLAFNLPVFMYELIYLNLNIPRNFEIKFNFEESETFVYQRPLYDPRIFLAQFGVGIIFLFILCNRRICNYISTGIPWSPIRKSFQAMVNLISILSVLIITNLFVESIQITSAIPLYIKITLLVRIFQSGESALRKFGCLIGLALFFLLFDFPALSGFSSQLHRYYSIELFLKGPKDYNRNTLQHAAGNNGYNFQPFLDYLLKNGLDSEKYVDFFTNANFDIGRAYVFVSKSFASALSSTDIFGNSMVAIGSQLLDPARFDLFQAITLHEIGHCFYRHTQYLVFPALLVMTFLGSYTSKYTKNITLQRVLYGCFMLVVISQVLGMMVNVISHLFEYQADEFAARSRPELASSLIYGLFKSHSTQKGSVSKLVGAYFGYGRYSPLFSHPSDYHRMKNIGLKSAASQINS